MNINILYEDDHLIVCEKPPGVPSQSDRTADFDMVSRLKNYLFEKAPDNGQPYVAVIHRLDRPVGGVMVFAKTPFAAKKLSEQIRQRIMVKKYLAVTTNDLSADIGKDKVKLTHFLVKDGKTNLSSISSEGNKNSQKAELYYRVLETEEVTAKNPLSLVEVELLTGRHHQIRVQLAAIGSSIWGDTKYNLLFNDAKSCKEWTNIALYAYQLDFLHPKTNKEIHVSILPKEDPFSIFRIIQDSRL